MAYQYNDLKPGEIRLINLLPGQTQDPLVCDLLPTSIDTNPSYKALSYTWGSFDKTASIATNTTPLPITSNLDEALRHIRHETLNQTLWVDAMCINQDNIPERNEQVRMMSRIYSSASEVIIWLGEKADNVDLAFEQLRTSHEAIEQHGDRYEPGSNAGHITHPGQSKSSTAMAMTALLERQWFKRTWIIQEAVLAKKATLMCGDLSLPFKSVTRVCSHWYKHNFRLITGLPVSRPLLAMAELQNGIEKKQNISLFAALTVTKGAESGDPRDRAFGLMSLVSAHANPGIEVDYYMSCEDLYALIIKHDIDANERLVMLGFAGLGLFSGDVKLPSWVPDWSLCDNFFMDLMCNTGYKAAKDTKPAVSWPEAGKAKMKAVFLDEIVDTGTQMLPDGFDPEKAALEGRGKKSHLTDFNLLT